VIFLLESRFRALSNPIGFTFKFIRRQMRDTQRFYARLGFGPVVVRRSVPVSVLRRRLAGGGTVTLSDHLVARRRTLRRVRAAVARTAD
jgi:hypothetical protein